MDTPKKENCETIIVIGLLLLIVAMKAHAVEMSPAQILIESYRYTMGCSPEDAERVIADLNLAREQCTDNYLKFQIGYGIAMLRFKAGILNNACDDFNNIMQAPNCPDLIILCSLNMSGQIHRMQARNNDSLDDFERLIDLSEKYLSEAVDKTNHSTVLILAITGGFSKAEIYQYQRQYDSAVAEYKRILSHIKEKKAFKEYSKYAYLALDRISQIHLINGNIEGYNEAVAELIKTYPDYYRIPIIKFEREAVNILNKNSICSDYTGGSYESPARLIEYIKNGDVKELAQRIQTFLSDLSKEYQGTYGGRMLGYHYAWLLDATGQKKAAIDVMNVVNKETVTGYFHNPAINSVISILGDYSKLYQALILGEMGDYENALDIARSVKVDPNNNHLSNLVDSIMKGLEILKREVHKNGNNQ